MEKLVLLAVIGSITAIQMRSVRHEYAVLIGSATAILLLAEGLLRFGGVSEALQNICGAYDLSPAMLKSVVKILGISYLTEFGVNISRDAGQQAIAGALELGGRVMILSCAVPAVVALFETGASLIRGTAL